MDKTYSRIEWENEPSVDTPLNATNLNKMDYALDTIDNRVITLDTSKTNQNDFLTVVQSITLNQSTGVITITQVNGTVTTYDTKLEKLAVNFSYDDDPTSAHYQQLIITLDDGTVQYVDMSALITQYEFSDTATIGFTISSGQVSASIKDGSVTRSKIDPDYLAAIDLDVAAAAGSATAASGSATTSTNKSLVSEGYAVGEQNGIPVDSSSPYYHNNAKYYSEQTPLTSLVALTDTDISNPVNGQALIYNNNSQKWENANVSGGGNDEFTDKTTTFNADGSITETYTADSSYMITDFPANTICRKRLYNANNVLQKTKTTTQNANGQIIDTIT